MTKTINILVILAAMAIIFSSCKKEDEDEEMEMNFKSGSGYLFNDTSLDKSSTFKIGIEAETEKKKDPLIKFNISESINGGSPIELYTQDLDQQTFEYDFNGVLSDNVVGNQHKYIFTVTNRDGYNVQKSLTITVK